MARDFDGTNDILNINAVAVTGIPFTLAAWFRADVINKTMAILWIGDKDDTNEMHYIQAAGLSGGDPVHANTTAAAGGGTAATTSGFSANTWHHAAGVWVANNNRAAFIDGGSKGTNANNRTPGGFDRIRIGSRGDSTPSNYFNGRIAEAAIYNVALSDAEVAVLASGVSPLRVRPGNLKGYWPIFGASPETDFSGQGNPLTVTQATVADHAPVAPSFGFIDMEAGAGEAAVAAFDTPILGASMVGILGG